jgi:hypothetical protein
VNAGTATAGRIETIAGNLTSPRQAAETRARHCEQAQAGYFYCQAAEGDPCGPGRYPHDGHTPGQCTRPLTAYPIANGDTR